MIHKIRVKLIAASMLSLLLVLAVIFGIVGTLNYQGIITDADRVLKILEDNDGIFPIVEPSMASEKKDDDNISHFSPELPFELRYFSVFLSKDGEVSSVNTGRIAAIDSNAAVKYAQKIYKGNKDRGFIEDYRYLQYSKGNETHIVFVDYGREMRSFRAFLINSAIVCAIGLLAVLFLMILLSARIVKPFSENYEKQKQFITDAGHELKTPLTIIDADAEILEMDIGENEWLRDIQAQTERLALLTNNLITLSRIEEQPKTEKISFPISDIIEEGVEAFQTLARTHNLSLSAQIQPMLSMIGDEKSMRQLITIFLDNAIKYTNDGGCIEVTLKNKRTL